MKNKNIIMIAAIITIALIFFYSPKTASVTFQLGYWPSRISETIIVDVSLPLDDNEACQVAKAAAIGYDLKTFECDDIQRVELDVGEILVVDDKTTDGFVTAIIIQINEKDKKIQLFPSP